MRLNSDEYAGAYVVSALKKLNIVLACFLVAAIGIVAVVLSAHAGQAASDAFEIQEEVPSNFVYEQESYDINPGAEYVVYTNYACPHCAELYVGMHAEDIAYTARILLLEEADGVFATQETVSAYMLKLYRTDPQSFDRLEALLFSYQDAWTSLDDDALLVWLNERSQCDWQLSDLDDEVEECIRVEAEAPSDLEFVPGVYRTGARCDGLMYEMLDRGAAIIEDQDGGQA